MDNAQMKIGQINAVLYAAEEVISRTSFNDRGTELMAKETAYDHIKKILADKCPWEGENENRVDRR